MPDVVRVLQLCNLFTVIDSWGKIPEGILHGHVNSMGDFDECVGLRASGVNFSDPFNEGQVYSRSFSGRYCSIALTPKPSTKDAAQSRSAVDPEEFLVWKCLTEKIQ